MALPEGTKLLSVCKGAPSFILEQCANRSLPVAREAITEDIKKQVLDVVDEYSSKAPRVLAI